MGIIKNITQRINGRKTVIYPITKASAVFDSNGDPIANTMLYSNTTDEEDSTVLDDTLYIDATTLNGKDGEYYENLITTSRVNFEDYTTVTNIPSEVSAYENITKDKTIGGLFSSVKAYLSYAITPARLANNTVTTTPGKFALDAAMGKDLSDRITKYEETIANMQSIVNNAKATETVLGTVKGGGNVKIASNGDMWANPYADKDKQTGKFITTNTADNGFVQVDVKGKTDLVLLNPDLILSPANKATLTNMINFDLVSCGVNICNNGTNYNNWLNNLTNKPDYARIDGGFILEILNDNLNSRIARNIKVVESFVSGKTYTLKADVKFLSNPNNVTVTPYINNPDIYGNGRSTDGELVFTFTYTNQKSVGIYFQNTELAKGTRVAITNIRISLGSVAIPHTEYKEGRINIPLDMGEFNEIKDCQYILGGKTLVLNGSENWGLNTSSVAPNTIRVSLNMSDIALGNAFTANLICDSFKAMSFSDLYQHDTTTMNGISDYNQSGRIYIRISTEYATDLETFKIWLSNNPITVRYKLATPSYTTLNNLLTSYEGVTNVYSTATIQGELTATYKSQLWSDLYKLNNRVSTIEAK